MTAIPLRPVSLGHCWGWGGQSRAESRREHPAAAQGGWLAARRLKQAVPLLKPFSFQLSRFSPSGDPDGHPSAACCSDPLAAITAHAAHTDPPQTMKSCPISLQETDTPRWSNSTHRQSRDPRSDSAPNKQPEPAGRHSPQDGQWSPGAPTQTEGVPPTLGVLDPAGPDDDGTSQVRELSCFRFCLSRLDFYFCHLQAGVTAKK